MKKNATLTFNPPFFRATNGSLCIISSKPSSAPVSMHLTSSAWVDFFVQTATHFVHNLSQQSEGAGTPSLQPNDRTCAVHK